MLKELMEYLSYDKYTGVFTWIKKPSKKVGIGSQAGYINKGYVTIRFKSKDFLAHRLAYGFMNGELPPDDMVIDHIDHNRLNNAIDNLRLVSVADNNRNRVRRTGKVDEAGIWYCRRRQRYIAEITYNQKKVYQRSFIDIDEAISQRKDKLLELGFHPNHGDKV